MKNNKITNGIVIFLCLIIISQISCKDPFSSDERKEQIRILLDDDLSEGKWIFFWDGKDKDGKYVSPGKYIYLLEVGIFQDQDYMTAESGGKKVGKNLDEHFETGYYQYFSVGTAYPEPFKVIEGVNIPIYVAETARVKLSIYKD